MKKLLFKIAFNGKNYMGFQSQKNGRTIQEKLTESAELLFGQKCLVTGCGRTDSGVHANGFCITVIPENCESDDWCKIPFHKIHKEFNIRLPSDIKATDTAFVDMDFHPRYDVEWKEYIYKISDDERPNPFNEGLVYKTMKKIPDESVEKMKQAACNFVGKYDFKAFMAKGSKIEDTVREIKYAEIERDENILTFRVAADGFLYNMVRIMTGTLIEVSEGKINPDEIKDIILSGERRRAGMTAPPDGLYLNKIEYTKEISWLIGN